jgi:hypothetical protein
LSSVFLKAFLMCFYITTSCPLPIDNERERKGGALGEGVGVRVGVGAVAGSKVRDGEREEESLSW